MGGVNGKNKKRKYDIMKDKTINLSKLKLNDRNPRTIKGEAFQRLCDSIKQIVTGNKIPATKPEKNETSTAINGTRAAVFDAIRGGADTLKKMHTSYFGNPAIKRHPEAVSIARWTPRWWGAGRRYIALAPPAKLLKSPMAHSPQLYEMLYREQVLAKLDPHQVAQELAGKILCCYEAPGQFCHRRLVADWLHDHTGLEVTEL